jgi:hypothetical protein
MVAADQLIVYRNGTETTGECRLRMGEAPRLYAVVGSLIRRHNAEFVTTGVPVDITRPVLTVYYAVDRSGSRRRELVLEASEPVRLPALVLRGRQDRPPSSRNDGQEVLPVPATVVRGRKTFPLPRSAAADMTFRLFTASPADGATISLERR